MYADNINLLKMFSLKKKIMQVSVSLLLTLRFDILLHSVLSTICIISKFLSQFICSRPFLLLVSNIFLPNTVSQK